MWEAGHDPGASTGETTMSCSESGRSEDGVNTKHDGGQDKRHSRRDERWVNSWNNGSRMYTQFTTCKSISAGGAERRAVSSEHPHEGSHLI